VSISRQAFGRLPWFAPLFLRDRRLRARLAMVPPLDRLPPEWHNYGHERQALNSPEQKGIQEDVMMQVQRFDPFSVLARMDREFDELVRRGWGTGRAAGSPAGSPAMAGFVPAVEVVRQDADVVVRLELPGVDVERDVSIEVERGRLIISGERRDPHALPEQDEQEHRRVLVRELRYGQFRREFALPAGISPDQVDATYDAGLLDVRVRGVVQPEPQPVRVPIKAGRSDERRVLEHEGPGDAA
jgi:HSP20 family protein